MSKIAIIGTGYVGLTTGAYLAHLGHDVTCADVDVKKVERLQQGEIPIVEPGLSDLVNEGIRNCNLRFVLGAENAVVKADFVFLAVPTPQGEDGSADLTYMKKATAQIAPHLQSNTVVINKSTVPVGASKLVQQMLNRFDVHVASNPEFLREGSAVHDCLHPDRVVIGADEREIAERVSRLYEKLDAPVIITDCASAETIKYASNAFLATKLTFINAMANVCEAVGADILKVAHGMGYDKRIGSDFLVPGPGFGGSCFPKDINALIKIAAENGYDFSLLRGVLEVNIQQLGHMVRKISEAVDSDLNGKRIAVWGLTFKANTDDLRDSPSLEIVDRLVSEGAIITAYDPTQNNSQAPHHPSLSSLTIAHSAIEAAYNADVLAILTEWKEFQQVDFDEVKSVMRLPNIVDVRNMLNGDELRSRGFYYKGVG